MRALNKGWIGIALVILFGASLFFFRGSSRYSNLFNSDNFVANVSGTPISTTQFARALEMNIGQFAQMIGEELTGDQIRAFQIHQLVLQNLVNNAIFENEFDKLNYILDETIIAENTRKRFPNLYVNNKINDDALNSFLRQQRLKIEDLVNIINYETRAVVFDNLFFEKKYPNEISNKINLFNNQTRDVSLLKIPYQKIVIPNFKENIDINNEDLQIFYNENTNKYMSEEKRDISYVVLNKETYKDNFTPNENEILEYFENNKDIYKIPEQRTFKQFNFKSKNEAENFKLRISGLEEDEILKFANDQDIKFNEFNKLNKNQVLDELSDVIFNLNKDEVSDVISTTLANHIVILNEISPEKIANFDDVREKIRNTLTNVQLDNYFNDLKLKINQQILDGYSINQISSENNLLINNFSKITRKSDDSDSLENTIIDKGFLENKDFVSDIYDFNEKISFLINVNNVYPSKAENISTVFDQLVKDFIIFKKINYANEIFEENKENSLEKINSFFNQEIEKINISLNFKDLPNSLINNIFDTDLNGVTVSSDEDNIYFAEVDNINIPKDIQILEDIEMISELKNAFGNEIIKTKNISINDELINGLLSQYK